jgi:hypothetical protein
MQGNDRGRRLGCRGRASQQIPSALEARDPGLYGRITGNHLSGDVDHTMVVVTRMTAKHVEGIVDRHPELAASAPLACSTTTR